MIFPNPLSLVLAPDGSPFGLSEDEMRLDGDWWAWQFLRLNPLYRQDVDLQSTQREKLKVPRHAALPLPLSETALDLPARRFADNGRPLGDKVSWRPGPPVSLRESLTQENAPSPGNLRIREFDSGHDYGLTQWLDPTVSSLPPNNMPAGWFSHLTEPLWDARDVRLHLETTFDGESPGYRFVRGRPSMGARTEIAFAVNVDGDVRPQLREVTKVLKAYVALCDVEGTLKGKRRFRKKSGCPVLPVAQARGAGWAGAAGAIETMRSAGVLRRPNWLVAVFDVDFVIDDQVREVQELLVIEQQTLKLPTRRQRRRDASLQGFWLKRALCMLTLHHAMSREAEKPISAAQVARAILDPSHPWNARVWPDRGPTTVPQPNADGNLPWDADGHQDALDLAKQLCLGQYEMIVGLNAEELRAA